MSGTKTGGIKSAQTNIKLHGADYYRRIGAKGGATKTKTPKGFAYSAAHGLDWHKLAGAKGGSTSRRNKEG